MLAASPKRLARRLLPIVPVVFFGCSDPSAPVSPRVELRAPSLDVLVVKVTNTDDSGAGSLRQAVFDAFATPGTVIQFDASLAGKTIVLTSGEIDVGSQMTIEGPASTGITVSAGLNSRIFDIGADGDLTLRNISIVNGRADFGGAAQLRDNTKLTLDHALVANNEALGRGGAVFLDRGTTLTIINSTVSGNVAGLEGGGIQGSGAVTLRGVTLRQTQKTTGKFTTIIEGSGGLNVASCGPTPSSWTVPVTATSGKFENGTATGSVTTVSIPVGFLQNTTSATVKVFLAK